MISSPELAVCLLVPLASCWLVHQLGWRLFHLGLTEFAVGLACAMGLLALTAYTEAAAASALGRSVPWQLGLQDAAKSFIAPRVAREWLPHFCILAAIAGALSRRFLLVSCATSATLFTLTPWRFAM